MGIFLTKGGGNGGNTPTPTPTEIKLYSEDDSIEVFLEFDENDNPTGWTNIERKNDLASEELEVGALVFMNFVEEDIVKKQQTYILSTNNGRKIEVTISGKYTIETLADINISVSGDVEDDDAMWVHMYMDPGDGNGNRYQGYFFIIYFGGPYQWTQDDDEAFYVSANSDKSLINWMWNGLSTEAYERLEEIEDGMFFLIDYIDGGEVEETEIKEKLYISWDTPDPDFVFRKPAILQDNLLNFVQYKVDRDAPSYNYFDIRVEKDTPDSQAYILGDFSLSVAFKDSGIRQIIGTTLNLEHPYFYLQGYNSVGFCAFMKSFNAQENNFPFIFIPPNSNTLDYQEFFRESAISSGFIPQSTRVHTEIDIRSMFYYCQHMTEANLDGGVFRSLYRTFKGCNLLEEVTIEQSTGSYMDQDFITSIEETFSGCTNLQTIHFIKCSLDTRDQQPTLNTTDAFLNCNSLTEIILERCSNEFVTEIQNNAPAGVTVTVINN